MRIGRAISLRLAEAGAHVVIHCNRSKKAAVSLRDEIRGSGGEASVVQADLSDAKERAQLIAKAQKACAGPLTLLVNNASDYPENSFDKVSAAELHASLDLTAWAPFELTRDFAKRLPARRRGAAVNLLDARLVDSDPGHVAYWLAKRMLADLTKMSASHFAPRITVNAVAPGPVRGREGDVGFAQRLAKHVPLRRTPTPDEVADAVAWLLAAPSVTGQTLYVDGGRHLGRAAIA